MFVDTDMHKPIETSINTFMHAHSQTYKQLQVYISVKRFAYLKVEERQGFAWNVENWKAI